MFSSIFDMIHSLTQQTSLKGIGSCPLTLWERGNPRLGMVTERQSYMFSMHEMIWPSIISRSKIIKGV